MPPSIDNVYEYIVFRGSDVKDLRIEEGPKEKSPPKPPSMPYYPAILGVGYQSLPSTGFPFWAFDTRSKSLMNHIGCITQSESTVLCVENPRCLPSDYPLVALAFGWSLHAKIFCSLSP